jgi:hypothetical protein
VEHISWIVGHLWWALVDFGLVWAALAGAAAGYIARHMKQGLARR